MSLLYSLSAVEVFQRLSDDARNKLAARLETRHLRRGEVLIEKGERADTLFLVSSGRFAVFLGDSDRSGIEIGRGQPIGEIGFFSDRPRTARVVAQRDSTVLALGRTDFDAVAERVPEIKDAIIRSLSDRLPRRAPRRPDRRWPASR